MLCTRDFNAGWKRGEHNYSLWRGTPAKILRIYFLKGKDVSKFVGKLVQVTGIITESNKGDIIEVKSIQEPEE
ncbi:MAG: hypothetical protein ABSF52_17265 [Syntrophobacteraceae bacterium]|jgi:hypothetical protein